MLCNCIVEAKPFVTRLFEVIKERSYLMAQPGAKPTSSNDAVNDAAKSTDVAGTYERKKDNEERKEARERDDDRKKSQNEKEKEQRKVNLLLNIC